MVTFSDAPKVTIAQINTPGSPIIKSSVEVCMLATVIEVGWGLLRVWVEVEEDLSRPPEQEVSLPLHLQDRASAP